MPAFYLYNFTNETQRAEASGRPRRDTKIHHYDFAKSCLRERPIGKVAVEPYLLSHKKLDGSYNHSLDNEMQVVENKAAASITELNNILEFALRKKPMSVEINNSIMDNLLELLFWQIKRHPDIVKEMEIDCEKYLTEKGNAAHHAKEMALQVIENIGKEGEYDIKNELNKKNKIIVCTSTKQAHFITTDKPFVRFNKSGRNGIRIKNTEMYFPITSNMLLFMHNNGNRKEFRLESHRNFLRKININIAKSRSNFLFGKSDRYLEKIHQIMTKNG